MLSATRFGIIGAPVEGSMSPRLFTAAYGGHYPYDLIEEDDFDKAWARFLAEYDGINITAPFKAQAAAAADIRSGEVVRIGAANLAVKTPQGIKAYNTDYEGVRRALREILAAPLSFRPRAEGPRGEISGGGDFSTRLEMTGGALEMTDGALSYRDRRSRVSPAVIAPRVVGLEDLREGVREADVVIYTIPFGITELDNIKKEDWEGRIVLEANYKTPVLAGCGARYISGKSWLLHQAYAGYELLTGEVPDFAAMKAALP